MHLNGIVSITVSSVDLEVHAVNIAFSSFIKYFITLFTVPVKMFKYFTVKFSFETLGMILDIISGKGTFVG